MAGLDGRVSNPDQCTAPFALEAAPHGGQLRVQLRPTRCRPQDRPGNLFGGTLGTLHACASFDVDGSLADRDIFTCPRGGEGATQCHALRLLLRFLRQLLSKLACSQLIERRLPLRLRSFNSLQLSPLTLMPSPQLFTVIGLPPSECQISRPARIRHSLTVLASVGQRAVWKYRVSSIFLGLPALRVLDQCNRPMLRFPREATVDLDALQSLRVHPVDCYVQVVVISVLVQTIDNLTIAQPKFPEPDRYHLLDLLRCRLLALPQAQNKMLHSVLASRGIFRKCDHLAKLHRPFSSDEPACAVIDAFLRRALSLWIDDVFDQLDNAAMLRGLRIWVTNVL